MSIPSARRGASARGATVPSVVCDLQSQSWDPAQLVLDVAVPGFPGGSPANAGDKGSILGQEDPLEKEMATYSSILAWEIPWTGRQPSMGSQKSQT